jgi:type VI secretion system protein
MPAAPRSIVTSRRRAAAGSLFDRLLIDEEDTGSPGPGDPVDAVVASIKRNLARVLNARSGGAASNPELGVVDFNDSSVRSNDMLRSIATSIRDCVERFEPRARDAEVEFFADPDAPLSLRFAVRARIMVADAAQAVRVDIQMNADQHFSVT